MFKASIHSITSYTKRDVLSVIARLYDPLGLIGPVISKTKIFLQKLWLRKLNWEEFLPDAIAPEWLNFVSSLKALEELKIDRYILADSYVKFMLLGYADAPESAYGAVVYMHSVKEDGTTTTKLISSKSRVAPIKVISIPRLELSASIAWINTPANQLKTFVDNRVSKIQTLTENFEWKHIPSAQNPADIISRGVHPEELSSLTLWWNGPQHLDIPEQFIDPSITSSDELYMSELKKQSDINLISILDSNFENELLNITNNYTKLIRIFSYIFRFLHNVKNTSRLSGPLTNEKLQKAKLHLIKRIQARHKWQFEKENVIPNSMVILKDENLPPCKWTMGRILEIVKGSDGKVRVVKVKTPQVYWARTHDMPAMIRYLDHWATAALKVTMAPLRVHLHIHFPQYPRGHWG
ncbi:integrase catalytic domain-containing protein [Trichonephila clavipes]|nr:integrase catalytic domain-containing protein [Trichonephila clavipes]